MAAAFQLCFMAFAVDVIDRCGPSNEMRCQLKLKKAKVSCISHLYSSKRHFSPPSLVTRLSGLVLREDALYG